MSLKFRKQIQMIALKNWSNWEPPVRPACAAWVSTVLKQAGLKEKQITWVPDFVNFSTKITSPTPGDLVMFKHTYDAVPPAGIGPEDDYTHVGIVVSTVPLQFKHYSASQDEPIISTVNTYWSLRIQEYRRIIWPNADVEKLQKTTKSFKLFYHPDVDCPTVVVNGDSDDVMEMLMTIRTKGGHIINMTSHPFEETPSIEINGRYYPVVSITVDSVKYLNHEGDDS